MKKILFLSLLIISLISLVSGQPPFIQSGTFTEGYDIKVPPIENIPQNEDFTLNFHVFNISNGIPIDNSSTDCFLHLYGRNGEQLIEIEVPHSDSNVDNEWEIEILGSNFSDLGNIGYSVQCNSATLGGRETVSLIVSKKGYSLETSNIILYGLALLILFFFWSISVYGGMTLPFNNIRGSENQVISVNWRKYLKTFSWGIVYFTTLAIDWMIWNLLYAYAEWSALSNVFFYIFKLMYAFALPVLIGMVIFVIINYVNDKKISSFIKRTGLPYDG